MNNNSKHPKIVSDKIVLTLHGKLTERGKGKD